MLIYYIYYKTYTKIENKKDEINTIFKWFLFYLLVVQKYFLSAPQWIVLSTPEECAHPTLETTELEYPPQRHV